MASGCPGSSPIKLLVLIPPTTATPIDVFQYKMFDWMLTSIRDPLDARAPRPLPAPPPCTPLTVRPHNLASRWSTIPRTQEPTLCNPTLNVGTWYAATFIRRRQFEYVTTWPAARRASHRGCLCLLYKTGLCLYGLISDQMLGATIYPSLGNRRHNSG